MGGFRIRAHYFGSILGRLGFPKLQCMYQHRLSVACKLPQNSLLHIEDTNIPRAKWTETAAIRKEVRSAASSSGIL